MARAERGPKGVPAENRKLLAERKSIDRVVINTEKEWVDWAITESYIKIELGEDGVAVIWKKSDEHRNLDNTAKYLPVDRKTGCELPADVLPYLEILSQRLEGKAVGEYAPPQIDPAIIKKNYQRAQQLRMITTACNTQTGIEFLYTRYPGNARFRPGKIDLARGIVEENAMVFRGERLLKPHFAEFLKGKKAELEQQIPECAIFKLNE